MIFAGAIIVLTGVVWWLLHLLRKETFKRGLMENENEDLQKANLVQRKQLDIARRATASPDDIIKRMYDDADD